MVQVTSARLSSEHINSLSISEEVSRKIDDVNNYDFSFLTNEFNDNQIRAGRPFSVEQVYPIMNRFGKADFEVARMLEEEFKKFVILTLIEPGIAHAPPGAVDMYWHFFILHTEQYIQFSESIWGNFQGDPKYRQHYPAKDDTRPGQFRAYVATRELYLRVYGEPPIYERAGAIPVPIWNDPIGNALASDRELTSGDSYSGIVEPETDEFAD
jgi:hypothetical protein